jgi:nitrogen fixation protein FixH
MMARSKPAAPKPLTGRKVLLIMVAAFAVIVTANMAMLLAATGSFPGLVVKNSYVASQGWDRKTAAQRALGWTAGAVYSGGRLTVTMTGADGAPVSGLMLAAVVGRPASDREDIRLELGEDGEGYAAPLSLAPGVWRVEITGTGAGGASFQAGAEFQVRDPA